MMQNAETRNENDCQNYNKNFRYIFLNPFANKNYEPEHILLINTRYLSWYLCQILKLTCFLHLLNKQVY